MTKNLSIFFIQDVGSSLSSPVADNQIKQITYQRPGNEDTFFTIASRFRLQSTITFPSAGIDTSVPLCAVNRKGSNGAGALDLFVRTTGGNIGWISSNTGGNSWGAWDTSTLQPPPGISIASGPAVSAFATDRLALVIRGSDNQLYRRFFTTGSWGSWITSPALGVPSGATLIDEPGIIGFPDNNYRVYVRTSSNELWYREFSNGTFGSWIQVTGATITSAPEGVAVTFSEPGAKQVSDQVEGMNVFYRGGINEMRLTRTSPAGSTSGYNFSGGLTSASGSAYFRDLITSPSSLAGSYYRELHTFVRGNDGLLYGKYGKLDIVAQTVNNISNWYSFGFAPGGLGRIFGKPDAVTWDGTPVFP